MRNKSLLFLLAAGTILSLTGCEKEPSNVGGDPKEVSFSVTTANPKTKTEYTGEGTDGEGGLTWERIAWVKGDPLLIWSDNAVDRVEGGNHSAHYSVGDPEDKDFSPAYPNQSWSIIKDDADLGLKYQDGVENFKFWSIYPASAATSTPAGGTGTNANNVSFIIPNSQGDTETTTSTATAVVLKPNMLNAVMLAAAEGLDDGSKENGVYPNNGGSLPGVPYNSNVTLRFYPAFTAFSFVLTAAGEGEIELDKVVLKSDENSPLAGNVSATVKEGVKTNTSSGNTIGASECSVVDGSATNELTYTFPAGTKVSQTKSLTFTVFALPQDINGLKLEFTYKNGVVVTADLRYNGSPITFAACKKHVITGLGLPASINKNIELVFQIMPWEDVNGTITYGPDPVVNAVALEYISGAQITVGGGRRRNNNFASADEPIHGYFYVYSPQGANWKITVTGDTSILTVTSSTEGASSSTTDGVTTITGATGGRVDFTITRGSSATSSSQIQLNFSVVTGGREVSINSEITRGNALTITGKVGE